MNVFYAPDLTDQDQIQLNADEARHIKALRLREGDRLQVTNGQGGLYHCTLDQLSAKSCQLLVVSREDRHRDFGLHIGIAPTKNLDRTEWMVEKCTEIGVDRISFFLTQNSERRHLKLDRLERVAVAAMKQSLKAQLPRLDALVPYEGALAQFSSEHKWIAHIQDGTTHAQTLFAQADAQGDHAMLIGPEGGFTEDEVQMAAFHGFVCTSLGTSRLRTETAAVVACAALSHFQ